MSTETDRSLDSKNRNSFFSHRKNAVTHAFIASSGLIAVLITIYVMMINLNNPEILYLSLGYMTIMLIVGSSFFIYSLSAMVWHILKSVEDIVKSSGN